MMLNADEEKALYPVLRHYTGVDIQDVSISVNGYDFLTVLGDHGQIQKSKSGDWEIYISDRMVEVIEEIVFNILVIPEEKAEMGIFLKKARNVLQNDDIRYRSKVLITNIIKVIEDFVLTSDFVPDKDMVIPPFWVHIYNGRKFINCLN